MSHTKSVSFSTIEIINVASHRQMSDSEKEDVWYKREEMYNFRLLAQREIQEIKMQMRPKKRSMKTPKDSLEDVRRVTQRTESQSSVGMGTVHHITDDSTSVTGIRPRSDSLENVRRVAQQDDHSSAGAARCAIDPARVPRAVSPNVVCEASISSNTKGSESTKNEEFCGRGLGLRVSNSRKIQLRAVILAVLKVQKMFDTKVFQIGYSPKGTTADGGERVTMTIISGTNANVFERADRCVVLCNVSRRFSASARERAILIGLKDEMTSRALNAIGDNVLDRRALQAKAKLNGTGMHSVPIPAPSVAEVENCAAMTVVDKNISDKGYVMCKQLTYKLKCDDDYS